MPLRTGGTSHLVRLVRGAPRPGRDAHGVRIALRLRLDRSVGHASWRSQPAGHRWARHGDSALRARLEPDGFRHRAHFHVGAGDTVCLRLATARPTTCPRSHRSDSGARRDGQGLETGPSNATRAGRYSEAVLRSLITLKALTYRPTGGIVAAPTTSLPERLGGTRNWDYRYLLAARRHLHAARAHELRLLSTKRGAWRDWLRRAVAGDPAQVQIMYGLAGERRLDEWEVPWLAGYEGSKPVRIGNAAAKQLQLDIYGEVMDALFQGAATGSPRRARRLGSAMQADRAPRDHLERAGRGHLGSARRPPPLHAFEGDGVGGGRPRHQERSSNSASRVRLQRWRRVRAQIHRQVCEQGYDPKLGAFVQSYGSTELDASALLIPLVGFLPPSDPRIRSTVEAIERI